MVKAQFLNHFQSGATINLGLARPQQIQVWAVQNQSFVHRLTVPIYEFLKHEGVPESTARALITRAGVFLNNVDRL
ncbi:hypothetical protein NBRC116589_01660 [Ruegeria sp. HU-ET01832]